MPKKIDSFTKEEFEVAYNEAMAFCEENSLDVIARQMAKDMMRIKELEKVVDPLVLKLL